MIDINLYMKLGVMKRELSSKDNAGLFRLEKIWVYNYLESKRSKVPVVDNIETTNACNMRCPFCPRTTMMTRSIKTMESGVYQNVVRQLNPHPENLWNKWVDFAQDYYKIPLDEQSENAFFAYILPKVIVLHGYGDPLLDKKIAERVQLLTDRNIPSYFSCNPANIKVDKIEDCFKAGLDYIKFSIDSIKSSVRGIDEFKRDYALVDEVMKMRDRNGYKTQIVITMINTGKDEFNALKFAFMDKDIYIYQKSLDQAWMLGGEKPKSIHWSEPCQFPWSSMTIKSDGMVSSCPEDYNNEIVLGNSQTDKLYDIWNGLAYEEFRKKHIWNEPGIRCTDGRCDMTVLGEVL